MSPLIFNALGTVAALCSMSSFVPQVLKIWKEKDASAVSLQMYAVTVTGFTLWTLYGFMLKSWPLIGSNLISLGLAITILVLRLKFGDGSAPANAEARAA